MLPTGDGENGEENLRKVGHLAESVPHNKTVSKNTGGGGKGQEYLLKSAVFSACVLGCISKKPAALSNQNVGG